MVEILIIAAIVAAAGYYAWSALAPSAKGKEACCEDGDDCAFKDFIEKEGNPERLKCSSADREKRMAEKHKESTPSP